jgi:hypothetical protein
MKYIAVKYFSWLSWRRPWVWLLGLFLVYNLTLAIVAPMVIKNQLRDLVVNRLKLNVEMDEVSVNPYLLSVNINSLKISGGDLGQPLGFKNLFINFQLWDSLGGIWTLKEAHLTGVYGEFRRIDTETHNFTSTINTWIASARQKALDNKSTDQTPTTENAETTASLPRVQVEDLQFQITQIKFIDEVPESQFETEIGPIDLHIEQLSSLPNTTGQHSLLLKTSAGVELTWMGNISLAPFASEGDVKLTGPVLTSLADYLKDDIRVAIATTDLLTKFHYVVSKPEESDLKIQLSRIEANVENLKVNQHPTGTPLIALKHLHLNEGELKWPEAFFQLRKIQLRDGDVWASTSPQGQLNFEELVANDGGNSESTPWHFASDLLSVSNLHLHYTDESTITPSQLEIENIALEVKNLGNKPQQIVQASAGFTLLDGKFESSANFQLTPLANIEGSFKVAQLPVKAAQGFVDDYALVDITQGELAAEGKITSKDEAINIQASAQIDKFTMLEKSTGKTLLAWSQLNLNRIIADLNNRKINVGRVRFNQAFADFDIAADGTHTLSRILKTPEPDASETTTTTDSSDEFSYLIGRIDFEDASGKFTDVSLPLPFSADVAHINGTISTLDSTSHSPANVKLEGQVSEYGEMVMTGAIFPLEPKQKTQMNLAFNNIDIAEFSPYSIKFAGREIAKGRMDLDLEYDINKSQMQGKNNIVLHDFALGKKVEQPGAVNLPLDLAVALLKDKDGVIRADLPVNGNVDDPKFGYGKTVRQAIKKLITNVAAAPFRLLAGLVGVGKNKDLGYISFFAGRTDLSPAQNEKVKQLGEALIKRPDLQITIAGVYSASFDTSALQEEKFDTKLRGQLSKGLTDANIGSRKYVTTLEKLYEERALSPSLDELKKTAQNPSDKEENQMLDQLAYVKTVKEKLVAMEPVTQEDLITLADNRARIVHQNLTQIPGVNPAQIKMATAHEGQVNKDNKLKLELEADLRKKNKASKTAQVSTP